MTTSTAPPPQLHTLAEVAKKYRLPLRPLQARARRDEFTHIHLGAQRLLTDEMVTALLATFTKAAKRPAATSKRDADMAKVADRLERQARRPSRRKTPA